MDKVSFSTRPGSVAKSPAIERGRSTATKSVHAFDVSIPVTFPTLVENRRSDRPSDKKKA